MAYNPPENLRAIQEARYGATGQKLYFAPELGGKTQTVDVGTLTFTLYRPGQGPPESTAITGPTVVTPDATTKTATYTLDASDTSIYVLGTDYVALVNFIVGGVPYAREILFDIVRCVLLPFIPVRIDDLLGYDSRFDLALSQALDSDGNTQATKIHQRVIQPAWLEVLDWVRAQGKRPALIADPVVLYQATRFRALFYLCKFLRETTGDPMDAEAKDLEQQYFRAQRVTKLKYREADTHAVSDERAFVQPDLSAGPDRAARGMGLTPMWVRRGRGL